MIRSVLQEDHAPNLKGDVAAFAVSLGLHALLCPVEVFMKKSQGCILVDQLLVSLLKNRRPFFIG